MLLVFHRTPDGSSHTTVRRGDGVVLEMRAYDRTHRVPHDLAHAVTERGLELRAGVFGCVAAGAVFGSMRVLSGRPRHDAAARSARVIKANSRSLTIAELMAGVMHDAVENATTRSLVRSARAAWGSLEERPLPCPDEVLTATARTLEELTEQWSALNPGAALEFTWPQRLTAPVPPAPRRRR